MATRPGGKNVVIDLRNYRSQTSAKVDPGNYTVVVDDVAVERSRNGNDMIVCWLTITEGDEKGQVLVDRLTITDKALFRIVGFMQALGLKTPKSRFKINADIFRGKRLIVSVADGEEYRGVIPSNVVGYMRAKSAKGGTEGDPWATDDVDEEIAQDEEEAVEEAVEETDSEPAPKAKAKAKKKAKKPEPEPEPEDDDDDDDDDDDEVDLDEVNLR